MGFRQDAYAKVWFVENKGNYSTARMTISRKDKNTGTYTTDFQDGFVRLVGQAHTALQGLHIDDKKGITIKISSCEVTNVYTAPTGKVSYKPQYTIYGLEIYDGNSNNNNKGNNVNSANTNNSGSDDFVSIPDDIDDGELPFN